MVRLTVITALLALAVVLTERFDFRRARWVLKPLASLGFLGIAYEAGALESVQGCAMALGLLFSLAGDVLLLPRDARAFFLAGLGAFLAAHVAYGAAFILGGVSWAAAGLLVLPFLGVGLGIGRWLLPSVPAPMRSAVVAYIVVIVGMVVLAGAHLHAGGSPLVPIAAVVFFLSDISVAIDRFKDGGFINRLWGLPAYYLAQVLFAWSLQG